MSAPTNVQQRSPSPMTTTTVDANTATAQQDPSKSNVVLYSLVLLIVGAALGNVLLAGKLKNLGKINYDAFKKASATAEAGAAQRHAHQHTSSAPHTRNSGTGAAEKSSTGDHRKATAKLPDVPAILIPHMKQLELEVKIENMHSEPIKGAFRKLAMTYHPDRISATDIRRKEFEGKFKDVSESYKFLKRYMIKSKTTYKHPNK